MMAPRKSIPNEIKLQLFSASAGHCQHPDCHKPLFPQEMGGYKHIGEMAHVIPHGNKGPRHEERPEEEFEQTLLKTFFYYALIATLSSTRLLRLIPEASF